MRALNIFGSGSMARGVGAAAVTIFLVKGLLWLAAPFVILWFS